MVSVPVTLLPETQQQRVRLLELPKELLGLITSENPPSLQLKSYDVSNGNGHGTDTRSVLCTPNQTYALRQVGTSNTVHLLQPGPGSAPAPGPRQASSATRDPDPDHDPDPCLRPPPGLDAVAKCDSTVELLPTPTQSAAPYLQAVLPTYTSTGNYPSHQPVTKHTLFDHIPLSEAECEQGWRDLSCFESTRPLGCYIPSSHVRAQIWAAALTSALADAIPLTDPFPEGESPPFARDLPGDWPDELIAAIFATIASPTPGGHLAVDADKAVRFAGVNLLQSKSEGKAVEATSFLKLWRDAVPEAWRAKCEFTAIEGSYSLQDGGSMVKFVDYMAAAAAQPAATEAKSLGAKRKWHEKFRASKKTA